MPEFSRLGRQVTVIILIALDDDRNAFDDFQTHQFDRIDLARVVGHQAQCANPELFQHRLAKTIIALIGFKAQFLVCLDRVGAAVLQTVCVNLVDQADAAPFLAQVQQNATTFEGNGPQGRLQLGAAIAALISVTARQSRHAAPRKENV